MRSCRRRSGPAWKPSMRPCKLETEQLKAVTDWLEKVQEIWEGNYKRLDALLAELKQAQKEERKK